MVTDENPGSRGRFRLSQEMIAIIVVGIVLAAQMLLTTRSMVGGEARADRAAWQTESQKQRDAWEAESQRYRDEARASREAFERELLRLREGPPEISTRRSGP